jgi:hypothetical protein
MAYRLTSACCLLLVVLAGGLRAQKKPPTLEWAGQWERTDLLGAYHSYIRMDDGRVANFGDRGETALTVAFTREPGNLLRWTPSKELMAFDAISDLLDPADPAKPAADRFMSRPTVVKLPSGDFLGLGAICSGYPAVNGLNYIVSYTGTGESVNLAKQAMLAGQEPPRAARWNYVGKVKGPVGEYLEKQTPFTIYPDVGSLIYLPEGPATPDHARPTRNRFLAFSNYVGAPDVKKKDAWLWTVLLYSADGREWFFAKDSTGTVRNLIPGYSEKEGWLFPFVLRHAADEWWMWRTDFQGDVAKAEKDRSVGADIFLYYSPDGLNWQLVRKEAFRNAVLGNNGKPLGVKNMSIYYDPKEKQIHGFLTVRNEDSEGFSRKYHNVAKVTRE